MSAITPDEERAANSERLRKLLHDAEIRGAAAALRKMATELENTLRRGGRITVAVTDVVDSLRISANNLTKKD